MIPPRDINQTTPWVPSERRVTSRLTGLEYRMLPASEVPEIPAQLSNVTAICNQPSLFEYLFKARFGGRPYELSDAQNFLDWASEGWQQQTHFVFFLIDATGLITATLDIKSANRAQAEVGYWCSEDHRGVMSKALAELVSLAQDAGFASLFAFVRKDNPASIKVLERNKFGGWLAEPGDEQRWRCEISL